MNTEDYEGRIAEIRRAWYEIYHTGYGGTAEHQEILKQDIPWLIEQLEAARREIESWREDALAARGYLASLYTEAWKPEWADELDKDMLLEIRAFMRFDEE